MFTLESPRCPLNFFVNKGEQFCSLCSSRGIFRNENIKQKNKNKNKKLTYSLNFIQLHFIHIMLHSQLLARPLEI